MSNYIPHYTKKLNIFQKKTERLRRLICQGADKEKLLDAAEDVRRAKMRALQAELANPPRCRTKEEGWEWSKNIDAKMSAWQAMTTEAILAEFGQPQ